MPPIIGQSNGPNSVGVLGEGWTGANGTGVYGRDKSTAGAGVIGYSDAGRGVWGHSNQTGIGVLGESVHSPGVQGKSQTGNGVFGLGPVGVHGLDTSDGGSIESIGVLGESSNGYGVQGTSQTGNGVFGWGGPAGVLGLATSDGGNGVLGRSEAGNGVYGQGLFGGYFVGGFEGIHVESSNTAARFEGDVTVNGNLTVTGNHTFGDIFVPGADCAEHFDMHGGAALEAGSVVVIDDDGLLRQCENAYDTKVAGVISGAGSYRPGLILDKQASEEVRQPIALVGKVYCKVDAQYSPIAVGDMLTTSPTPGHAMKAADPQKAFGAVIGKALDKFEGGVGMVRILVSLQ